MKISAYLIAAFLFTLSACSDDRTTTLPQQAAIASAHPIATQAGFEILSKGGNAFDAAVAVSAALAVVEPYSSGMGGGGFWLLHRERDQKQIMIDGRERAPLAAHRDMYLDKAGNVIPGLSINGALAAGIPGQAAALAQIAKQYGQLSLADSLAPAIRAAREGFEVSVHYQRMAKFRLDALRSSPAAASIFLKDNDVPPLGWKIMQTDLANTLEQLALKGVDGFYAGEVGQKLVSGTTAAGGIWTAKDLAEYKIKERQPVVGEYKGYRIITAAPPSSGGIAMLSMLNMLSQMKTEDMGTIARTHHLVEVMRRAYRDRAEFMGDPDFVSIPTERLLNMEYAKQLVSSIDTKQATPSALLEGVADTSGGNHTTHFSILDKQGNRVSATLSINYPFGSCFVPPGTGVLLNDEMDDFSAKPGVPNAYGLVGAEANAIAAGKRMLSSMTPTFIESDDRLAIIGTPGGSRIITMVLHGLLGVVEDRTAEQIVSQARFHHQYLPDVIQHEKDAFSDSELKALQSMGHQFEEVGYQYGNMQVVIWDRNKRQITAASDPRGEGLADVR